MKTLKNCAAFKSLLRENKKINLILLNIDNFSNINELYGVKYGNKVLHYIEELLHGFNFPGIDIYKLESDEFALISNTCFEEEVSIEIANEVSSYFNESSMDVDDDVSIQISFSMGIAIGTGLEVLNHARLAIKELREHIRGTYNVFDINSPYIKAIKDNVYWVNKIQESISEDEISAFFQPIYNNKTKKIEKYECLARIEDKGKFVSPYHFMSAAKETRLISFITKSMIKQSCKIFSKNDYEFSINITNDDLQLGYLEEFLLRSTALYNINPKRIILELLENISSLDTGTVLEQLASLKAKGFQLAIDDFGSDSSNFTRLLEFEPDYLKIDGTFIKNILTDKKSQIITAGIVSIAHQMGIKMIAEFIENEDVQEKIEELEVDYSQGYLHGKPLRDLL